MLRRGIERALDQIEAERGQRTEAALGAEQPGLPRTDSAKKEEVQRSVMREKRSLAWKHLSINERDVLTVLSAVCKVGVLLVPVLVCEMQTPAQPLARLCCGEDWSI